MDSNSPELDTTDYKVWEVIRRQRDEYEWSVNNVEGRSETATGYSLTKQ